MGRYELMTQQLLNDRDINFILYELLDTEALLKRPRYSEHSKEIFDATINTARSIAEKFFANHNAKGDANEPTFKDGKVTLIPETKEAWDAFAAAGFLAAHHDFEHGGMQLPEVVLRGAMAYFFAANVATTAYPFLSIGAANLIHSFGNQEQKQTFLPPMLDGRFAGTMALTEPNQGSALADIKTIAKPQPDGSYRIFGNKMYISGGDQSLTDNIVHMVLAKIEGAPAGVKGISLFICPKFLVNADGSLGRRNDVALAGLLHKMGYRNTTSTVLNFGENDGAVGYLVGKPHHGLSYMFQMMNEARLSVGMGAAALGYQGFIYSLDYAKQRPQGRLPSEKDPTSKQINIIEHADVKRMLLAQKAYAEGALAMCLYGCHLFEDSQTAATEALREEALLLLDLLTPIIKSWPSKYGLEANALAIQVLGGAGYIREYPVEQLYRDNRLNPIHEGTEGIHGIDLLGRKVMLQQGKAFNILTDKIRETLAICEQQENLAELRTSLTQALALLVKVTTTLAKSLPQDPNKTLANATVYLDMFGRILASWLWLKQAIIASRGIENTDVKEEQDFYRGKIQAARYYLRWELPVTQSQATLLLALDDTTQEMQNAWF